MGLAELTKKVHGYLAQGVSRPEILAQMAKELPQETAKIAYAISSVPTEEKRKKYLKYNAALVILLVCCSVLNLLAEMPIDLTEPTLFLLIKVVAPLVGAYFAFQFHGGVYRVLALWLWVDLFEAVLLLNGANLFSLLKIPLLMVVFLLSLMIGMKVFPQLKFIGPKSDEQGRYFLQ
jgi:hypothetical protein